MGNEPSFGVTAGARVLLNYQFAQKQFLVLSIEVCVHVCVQQTFCIERLELTDVNMIPFSVCPACPPPKKFGMWDKHNNVDMGYHLRKSNRS